jgi:methyl-accepting chemotaxis protein
MPSMQNIDNQTIQLAIVGVVALALLLQAFVLLLIFFTMRKAAKSLKEELEDLRSAVMPVIYNTRDLFTKVAPKVESTATDMAGLARGLRQQTADMQSTADEILERLRRQAARVDGMASEVLNTVDKASAFMSDAVQKPVRQISGLIASAKAVVDSLRESAQSPAPPHDTHSAADKDMFV